ncbi:MAG: helix-hairpin-helix domain-containing protein [Promethearchaeota archaeon]
MVSVHVEKKWDLAFLFENLQEILLNENHIEQAMNFAENALNEAQTQENAEWTAKFQEILSQLAKTRNLYGDPLQSSKTDIQVIQVQSDDLTIVKGIGPTIALKLKSNGFNTIQEIANSTAEQIARMPGIGVATASKVITNAKEYLIGSEEQSLPKIQNLSTSASKELTPYEGLKPQIQKSKAPTKNLNEWVDTRKYEYSKPEIEIETEKPLKIKEEKVIAEEFEEEDLSFMKEHEVKPLRNQVSTSHFTRKEDAKTNRFQKESHRSEPQVESTLIPLPEPVRAPDPKINRNSLPENVPKIDKNQIYQKIANTIKIRQFHEILLNNQDMREFRRGVDHLGCKIITVSNNTRLIVLTPIKFLPSQNHLMVSESRILKPISTNESSSLQFIPESIAEAHARQLKKVSDAMFDSITNEGTLFSLISRYFGLDAIVQKGFKQKPLFIASGEIEYEIIIDPILVTNQSVSSIEKTIPFPYQHSSNLHVVELEELQELMEYLEQKHALLVTQGASSNSLVDQLKMKNSFYKNIKNYSLPFLGFGAVFSLFLVMQMGDLVRLFTSLGIALIFIYAGAIVFVLYRYVQASSNMTIHFKMPHHEKYIELPKEDLILISEEFSEEWMAQLEHEVIYGIVEKPVKLKKNNFTTFRSKKSNIEPKKEHVSIILDQGHHEQFESRPLIMETEFEKEQEINDPVLSKYRSFLDD